MRFFQYITEDYEEVREYKKAQFDLKVALGEKEYAEGEKPDQDPERRKRQKESLINIKKNIINLKFKIQQMSTALGEEMDSKLKEVLATIPNKEDVDPSVSDVENSDNTAYGKSKAKGEK